MPASKSTNNATAKSKGKGKAASSKKRAPSRSKLDAPPASILNLWTVSSDKHMKELWADSYSCSRDDLDVKDNKIYINAVGSSSLGVFDGETRRLGWIPGHYYDGARLTLHQSVFYESYLLAGWCDDNSEEEAACFSGLVSLANYYRWVFLDLVLTTAKQFEGPCPENWRWPRFDHHLMRELYVGIHDPKNPKVKAFSYDKPDPASYDWVTWSNIDDTKKAMFHSPHFDCFRGLSWHGLTIGGNDLTQKGFASSVTIESLRKLARTGDPEPTPDDDARLGAVVDDGNQEKEGFTPEAVSTTGLVDSLNAAVEMSVEERECTDHGSEVDEKRVKKRKQDALAKVDKKASPEENSAARKVRKLAEKGGMVRDEIPSGSQYPTSSSKAVMGEYTGERNDPEGDLSRYDEPPVMGSETIYEGSNVCRLVLSWTDKYPNQHDISSGRYHRFVFGVPVRVPEADPQFLVIPRHDVLTSNVCLALIAPLRYHDHLAELLQEIVETTKEWLGALASCTDSEAGLHGVGTWLRYLDDCREKIFDEIREKIDQHQPKSAPLDDVRLPILEEWTVKHQLSLHVVPSDSVDHAKFLPENIPAVVAETNRRTLDCRPGTNESYLLKPPRVAADDVLDASQSGLGGSPWKRETLESILFQHSQSNSVRDEKNWIPEQALKLENPMSAVYQSLLQIETVQPISVSDPTEPSGYRLEFAPASHRVLTRTEGPTSPHTQDPEELCRSMAPEKLAATESFFNFAYGAREEDDMASQSHITGPDGHDDSSHPSAGQHLSVDLDTPQNDTNDTDDHICLPTRPFSDDDGSVGVPAVSRSDGVSSASKRCRGRPRGSKSRKEISSTLSKRTLRSSHQDDHMQVTALSDSSTYSVKEVILKSPSKPKKPSRRSPQDARESDSVAEQGGVPKTSQRRATSRRKKKVSKKSTASTFNLVANGAFATEADVKFLETLAATIKATRNLIADMDTYSDGVAQLHELAKAVRRMKSGASLSELTAKVANLKSSRDDAKSLANALKDIPRTIHQCRLSQNQVVQTITKKATKDVVHLLEDFCALGWDIQKQ